jgi:hypothetical protein
MVFDVFQEILGLQDEYLLLCLFLLLKNYLFSKSAVSREEQKKAGQRYADRLCYSGRLN